MKKGQYKNYRECIICHKILPLTREYFMRYSNCSNYHNACRECESQLKVDGEWKDGNLLCHKCLHYKPENEFYKEGKYHAERNYRKLLCKVCANERQRQHDINLCDSDKLRKCLQFRVLGAKDRAKNKNIPFDITLEYVQKLWNNQDGKCALSGLPMTYELKCGRTPTNVSIDRIDKTKGYIIGNVQLVCMACNQIKSDMSEDWMYYFCKNIVDNYENAHRNAAKFKH